MPLFRMVTPLRLITLDADDADAAIATCCHGATC